MKKLILAAVALAAIAQPAVAKPKRNTELGVAYISGRCWLYTNDQIKLDRMRYMQGDKELEAMYYQGIDDSLREGLTPRQCAALMTEAKRRMQE